MKVDRKKLELAMARSCMSAKNLAKSANMPRPTVKNAIAGRNIRPVTLGRIAAALGVDPAEIIEEVPQ